MNKRIVGLPSEYQETIETELERLGYSFRKPAKLAAAILRLSDFYVAHPDQVTPWHEQWAQAASIAYYFPLNYARNAAVAQEAHRLGFFSDLTEVIDIGSGTGSALFAFLDRTLGTQFSRADALDVSNASLDLALSLKPKEKTWSHQAQASPNPVVAPKSPDKTLLLASYVLTELAELPKDWLRPEALAIIEPSTQEDGRNLMRIRQQLIDQGYKIWAPCTHHGACPLLVGSERDWCHDRIHWAAPAWFTEIEKHLPMKNRTLTFSYLLARKTLAPPARLGELARLVGDTLVEKGKNRQAVCQGPEREFLAWFPQRLAKGEEIELQRGSLVRLQSQELVKKSSEIRLSSPDQIKEIGSQDSI